MSNAESAANALQDRIAARRRGWLDIRSNLRHFALINYATPIERLRELIPQDRFEIQPFDVDGRTCGLLSVVPFLDDDFHFATLAPFAKFRFYQTNHRVYVLDRQTGEPCVWFFGTTLGSAVVHIARRLWRIPWHPAAYQADCILAEDGSRYERYRMQVASKWCDCEIELEDTGKPLELLSGFETLEQLKLELTHPVTGFFHRLDNRLGSYSVWHDEIPLTLGRLTYGYFSLYEQLGLLTRSEMREPHSVLLCPQTLFEVHMPPRLA